MIFVDVETTGLDPVKNGILSIGAVDFSNPANTFYEECRLEKGKEVNEQALEVNGFNEENLRDSSKRELKDVLIDFMKWAQQIEFITLGGHNTSFDRAFLKYAAKKYRIPWIFGHRVIDLHSEAIGFYLRKKFQIPMKEKKADVNLDFVLKSVGLLEEPKPHNALTGAKMEAESYHRLLFKKFLFQEFKKYPCVFSV